MTASTHRFDELDLDLDAMTTAELVTMHADLESWKSRASNPVLQQALALRAYQVESVIAVRNARTMADLDEQVETRTVSRIAEWLRTDGRLRVLGSAARHADGIAKLIEDGAWRTR